MAHRSPDAPGMHATKVSWVPPCSRDPANRHRRARSGGDAAGRPAPALSQPGCGRHPRPYDGGLCTDLPGMQQLPSGDPDAPLLIMAKPGVSHRRVGSDSSAIAGRGQLAGCLPGILRPGMSHVSSSSRPPLPRHRRSHSTAGPATWQAQNAPHKQVHDSRLLHGSVLIQADDAAVLMSGPSRNTGTKIAHPRRKGGAMGTNDSFGERPLRLIPDEPASSGQPGICHVEAAGDWAGRYGGPGRGSASWRFPHSRSCPEAIQIWEVADDPLNGSNAEASSQSIRDLLLEPDTGRRSPAPSPELPLPPSREGFGCSIWGVPEGMAEASRKADKIIITDTDEFVPPSHVSSRTATRVPGGFQEGPGASPPLSDAEPHGMPAPFPASLSCPSPYSDWDGAVEGGSGGGDEGDLTWEDVLQAEAQSCRRELAMVGMASEGTSGCIPVSSSWQCLTGGKTWGRSSQGGVPAGCQSGSGCCLHGEPSPGTGCCVDPPSAASCRASCQAHAGSCNTALGSRPDANWHDAGDAHRRRRWGSDQSLWQTSNNPGLDLPVEHVDCSWRCQLANPWKPKNPAAGWSLQVGPASPSERMSWRQTPASLAKCRCPSKSLHPPSGQHRRVLAAAAEAARSSGSSCSTCNVQGVQRHSRLRALSADAALSLLNLSIPEPSSPPALLVQVSPCNDEEDCPVPAPVLLPAGTVRGGHVQGTQGGELAQGGIGNSRGPQQKQENAGLVPLGSTQAHCTSEMLPCVPLIDVTTPSSEPGQENSSGRAGVVGALQEARAVGQSGNPRRAMAASTPSEVSSTDAAKAADSSFHISLGLQAPAAARFPQSKSCPGRPMLIDADVAPWGANVPQCSSELAHGGDHTARGVAGAATERRHLAAPHRMPSKQGGGNPPRSIKRVLTPRKVNARAPTLVPQSLPASSSSSARPVVHYVANHRV